VSKLSEKNEGPDVTEMYYFALKSAVTRDTRVYIHITLEFDRVGSYMRAFLNDVLWLNTQFTGFFEI